MTNRWGNSDRLYFPGLQNHCRWWLQPWNSKTLTPWKNSYDQSRQHIKKQRHYFANKILSSQSYGFPNSNLWIWVCMLVAQSCLTLCEPRDCSLRGFSIHGILHSRIWEWIVFSFSRGNSQPRDWTLVFCIGGRFFTIWATGKWCESWTIKKAEHWRIDAFELWCWRRLLRFHWTARRSNESILKEISPEYS